MFKRRTLFIVGAGASHEFGLPIGTGLASTIASKLNFRLGEYGRVELQGGDKDLFRHFLRTDQKGIDHYVEAAWLIRDGILLSNSIDDFLDVHGKNETVKNVGKAAIVRSILESERSRKLFVDQSNTYNKMNMRRVEDTWIMKFVRMLGRGVPLESIETIFANVAFVIFNYDRCIEHFLLHALQHLYSISEERACEILKKLTVIHPYGTVASLRTVIDHTGIPFGGEFDRFDPPYLTLAQRIKTYTEQIEEDAEVEKIHKEIIDAASLVFLGFAFHDQNLKMLKPKKLLKPKILIATEYGMSDSDAAVVRSQLIKFFDTTSKVAMRAMPHLKSDMTCTQLFDHYTKTLPA